MATATAAHIARIDAHAAACHWRTPGRAAGQIVSRMIPQLSGAAEGNRGACPKMVAAYDASDRTWVVEGLGQVIRGKGELPSVADALAAIRKAKAAA